MSTTHLQSVDSNTHGETAGPSRPGGGDGDPPKRPKRKNRPKYPVPTDRMKFDTAVDALIAACVASNGGNEPVTAETQASFMGVSEATAPLNNAFFCAVGLLDKVGKGEYLPTETAHRFQQKWSFDKTAAPAILRPAFEGTWFHDAVRQRVQVGTPTRTQMIETLASIAGTDSSYATQYGFLLEWLDWVGLIRISDDGIVTLVDTDHSTPERGQDASSGEASETEIDPEPAETPAPPGTPATAPVVAVSFDVRLTADDLAALPSETIADLFDGIGKIAAVKAALKD